MCMIYTNHSPCSHATYHLCALSAIVNHFSQLAFLLSSLSFVIRWVLLGLFKSEYVEVSLQEHRHLTSGT